MTIDTIEAYKQALQDIYLLMNKGEANLTAKELEQVSIKAQAIEHYEDTVLKLIPQKSSIGKLIEQKLKENHLTQKALAEMYNMSKAKISQILSGKRPADVEFLKCTKEKLGIDGNVLLDLV